MHERTGFSAALLAWPLLALVSCKATLPAAGASQAQAAPAGQATLGAASPSAPNGTPSANALPGTNAIPTGTIAPELAGKWCYMANVDGKDGGRESSTCFTLNDDGTYQFRADGDAPAPFTGVAPPSTDVGHWAATADALSVVNANGQLARYPFKKKNHPKTRDPMLVLSGQPFVTVFQKPSW